MDLVDIISIIPDLLIYFVPGFVALRIRINYGMEKRFNSFDTVLYSVLYSFIVGIALSAITAITEAFEKEFVFRWFSDPTRNTINNIVLLLLGVMLGYVLVKSPEWKIGSKIRGVFNSTIEPYSSVWYKAVNNPETGAYARVYLSNGLMYDGILKHYTTDPDEEQKELVLTAYVVRVYQTDNSASLLAFDTENLGDNNASVLLKYSDILSIEIIRGAQ